MDYIIDFVGRIENKNAYLIILELKISDADAKVAIKEKCSYVIKSKWDGDALRTRIEISAPELLSSVSILVYNNKQKNGTYKRVWFSRREWLKYVLKKKKESIANYNSRILWGGEFEDELHYFIDDICYIPSKGIAMVRGWSFAADEKVKIAGLGKTSLLGISENERNDVAKVFGCRNNTGFQIYLRVSERSEYIDFSLSYPQVQLKIHVLKSEVNIITDKHLAIEKTEECINDIPYKHRTQKDNPGGFSQLKSIDIIVACNSAKWLKNILEQRERLCGSLGVNLHICINKNDKQNFEKIIRGYYERSDVFKQMKIDDFMICSDANCRNELRMEGLYKTAAEYVVFMDQEDSIDVKLLYHFRKAMIKKVKIVCTDYDLVYGGRHISRVIRTYDSVPRENPDLMMNSCCLRVKFVKKAASYNELIKIISDYFRQKDYYYIDDFIGYHYNCVRNEWKEIIEKIKPIAFYLTQFHENEENNRWWGKGFTEWSNVKRGRPMFEGHHQPRIPGELGYYDLVEDNSMLERQAKLAEKYGIYGFCFYYYWFEGKRLLRKPLDLYISNSNIHLRYCICWANESWTRRWDGLEQEVLMQQVHNEETDVQFIYDIIPMLRDDRYIKVNGKPLVLIYRMDLLPEPEMTVKRWREICRDEGIGDIHISGVQSFQNVSPLKYNADSAVEFPPHKISLLNKVCMNEELKLSDTEFDGNVYSYRQVVENMSTICMRDYTLFPGSMLEWDNTARRMNKSNVFLEFNPELFKIWNIKNQFYTRLYNYKKEGFVFVNAWNEWAEGSYLEPDNKYGLAALESVKDIINLK